MYLAGAARVVRAGADGTMQANSHLRAAGPSRTRASGNGARGEWQVAAPLGIQERPRERRRAAATVVDAQYAVGE